MTREKPQVKGEGKVFSSPEEVRMAYDAGEVDLQAAIKVRFRDNGNRELVPTTVGRKSPFLL